MISEIYGEALEFLLMVIKIKMISIAAREHRILYLITPVAVISIFFIQSGTFFRSYKVK